MSVRVGINGFGRIGRLVVRALRERPDLVLVHVNELFGDAATAAHLLEFDTVHGRYPGTVATDLSAPFTGRVPPSRLFTTERAAGQLLDVIEGLDAADTGGVFAWDASRIEY